jgi:hypothetical protein
VSGLVLSLDWLKLLKQFPQRGMLLIHAAKSIWQSSGLVLMVCQPLTFRFMIWPDANKAQNRELAPQIRTVA